MIIGFAHLTVAASDANAEVAKWIAAGWEPNETFEGIASAEEKLPLLHGQARRHDLVLLRGKPTVEIVAHDTGVCPGQGPYRLAANGVIGALARNVEKEAEFYCRGLGFVLVDLEETTNAARRLELRSRFPNWCVSLELENDPAAPIDPPLDCAGFPCLAFYSTDLAGDLDRLLSCGGRDPTNRFELILGNRRVSVHMLRSPQGAIIELAKIQRYE
ncbi:MAG: hypothetical protein RIC14_00450 [Filomicrobium sp.]